MAPPSTLNKGSTPGSSKKPVGEGGGILKIVHIVCSLEWLFIPPWYWFLLNHNSRILLRRTAQRECGAFTWVRVSTAPRRVVPPAACWDALSNRQPLPSAQEPWVDAFRAAVDGTVEYRLSPEPR